MKPIHDIENLPPEAIELFEAAGYMDAETIFEHKISEITQELIKANNVLSIIATKPTREIVVKWLQQIKNNLGQSTEDEHIKVDPNILIKKEDILDKPFSLPITKQFIKDHSVDILDVPRGDLRFLDKENAVAYLSKNKTGALSYDVLSDVDFDGPSHQNIEEKTVLFDRPKVTNQEPQSLDMTRIAKMETYQKDGSKIAPLIEAEDINHTRSTTKETNKGVKPNSKFYVKGVYHKNAPRFKSGCRWFILVNFLIVLTFLTTSLVLVDKEKYGWAVWAPLLGVVSVILYFSVTQNATCPICNQKQFAPKICRKHKDAHHWPILGYMLPTALHALIFKWFKCIFCGTSVRLKK